MTRSWMWNYSNLAGKSGISICSLLTGSACVWEKIIWTAMFLVGIGMTSREIYAIIVNETNKIIPSVQIFQNQLIELPIPTICIESSEYVKIQIFKNDTKSNFFSALGLKYCEMLGLRVEISDGASYDLCTTDNIAFHGQLRNERFYYVCVTLKHPRLNQLRFEDSRTEYKLIMNVLNNHHQADMVLDMDGNDFFLENRANLLTLASNRSSVVAISIRGKYLNRFRQSLCSDDSLIALELRRHCLLEKLNCSSHCPFIAHLKYAKYNGHLYSMNNRQVLMLEQMANECFLRDGSQPCATFALDFNVREFSGLNDSIEIVLKMKHLQFIQYSLVNDADAFELIAKIGCETNQVISNS